MFYFRALKIIGDVFNIKHIASLKVCCGICKLMDNAVSLATEVRKNNIVYVWVF